MFDKLATPTLPEFILLTEKKTHVLIAIYFHGLRHKRFNGAILIFPFTGDRTQMTEK